MANHKSAIKRIRSNERKRIRNRLVRSRMRTFVKKAHTSLQGEDTTSAREATLKAIQELDRAVSKGVIHKNTAARQKSRLMKHLNAMG